MNLTRKTPTTILLIGKNSADARIVREALPLIQRSTCSLVHMEQSSSALEWLANQRNTPDQPPFLIVLIDLSLIEAQSYETIAHISQIAPDTPVLILCTLLQEPLAISCLRYGAVDYILKEHLGQHRLAHTLSCTIERSLLREELTHTKKQLQASEERTHDLITYSDDAIVVVGSDGYIQCANPAAEQLLERPTHELQEQLFGFPVLSGERTELEVIPRGKTPILTEMRLIETTWSEQNHPAYFILLRDVSDQARQQEALRRSHITICIIDQQGSIHYADTTAEALIGYSHQELLTMNILDITHPDDISEVQQCLLSVPKPPGLTETIRYEQRILTRRGDERWFDITASAIEFKGYPSSIMITAVDVTTHKHIEQALHDSEQRFKRLLTTVTDYIYMVEVENGSPLFTSHGHGCFAVTGYTSDEYVSDPELWYRMVHEEDRPQVIEQARKVLSGQHVPALEHRIIHKDGSIRWVKNTPAPFHDEGGNLVAYDGLITDITERKHAEEALRQSEIRYRAIVENQTELVCRFRTDSTVITFINLAACRYFGKSRADLLGRTFLGLVYPEDRKRVRTTLRAHQSSTPESSMPPAAPIEHRVLTEHHGTRWLQWSTRALVNEQESMVEFQLVGRDITEQITAQEAYRILVEHSLQGIILFQNHRLQFANPMAGTITGYTVGELLSFSPEELNALVHPDDQEMVSQNIHHRIKGEACPERYACRIIRKDGATRWIAVSSTTTMYRGHPAIQTTFVDFTDQKNADEILQKAYEELDGRVQERTLALSEANEALQAEIAERNRIEEQLRFQARLLNEVGQAIIATRPDGSIIYWNHAAETLYGWATHEVMGQNILAVTPSETMQQQAAEIMETLQQGIPYTGEFLVRHRDGMLFPVLVTDVPLYDEDGTFSGIIGVSTDMTERNQIEEALRKSETRFRLLAENAQDIIFRFRMHPHPPSFEYISPSITNIFGYTPEEYYADPYLHIRAVHPDSLPQFEQFLESPATCTEPLVLQYRRKDHKLIWIEQRQWPVFDESGTLLSIEGITRDITAWKENEDHLRRINEEVQAATRAKSEFLANMSHEMRTPLNAVIGMTTLLLGTPLNTEQRDFVETARTSSNALLTIINDILDFSKIEAGRLDLEQQPFDLRSCVEESLDLVVATAAEKQLDLIYLIDHRIPQNIIGDAGRLRQILINLLSNAVKFTEQGEVFVEVQGEPCQTESDHENGAMTNDWSLHIKVRDTGIGIDPARQTDLFQSFRQLDASATRKYGGTGLGLAISQRLARMMGGAIWVESTPGQGTTFHTSIVAPAVPQPEPSPERRYLNPQQPALAGKRVLVVDHNQTNLCVLSQHLTFWGMVPYATTSPDEALQWLQHPPQVDIALIDLHLETMDGLALVEKLQAPPRPHKFPLVLMMSIGARDKAVQSSTLNIATILTSPVKPSQLYETLLSICTDKAIQHWQKPQQIPIDSRIGEHHPLRILLAEDNVVNQKVAVRFLERMGYRADVAANGIEVIEALKRQPYDVVLMDVQMPEMDGIEATLSIRTSFPAEQQPTIIAMTAHVMEGDREWCLSSGMDYYVGKPIKMEELAEALLQVQATVRT